MPTSACGEALASSPGSGRTLLASDSTAAHKTTLLTTWCLLHTCPASLRSIAVRKAGVLHAAGRANLEHRLPCCLRALALSLAGERPDRLLGIIGVHRHIIPAVKQSKPRQQAQLHLKLQPAAYGQVSVACTACGGPRSEIYDISEHVTHHCPVRKHVCLLDAVSTLAAVDARVVRDAAARLQHRPGSHLPKCSHRQPAVQQMSCWQRQHVVLLPCGHLNCCSPAVYCCT
eukprot:GHRQ01017295.1.p1 GENE.GHRQ01017295.1~~GHRQ01017295.1.p1  ORF type:complete len:230 (+),score=31.19 GHRQ01017295.1:106-795(+)